MHRTKGAICASSAKKDGAQNGENVQDNGEQKHEHTSASYWIK